MNESFRLIFPSTSHLSWLWYHVLVIIATKFDTSTFCAGGCSSVSDMTASPPSTLDPIDQTMKSISYVTQITKTTPFCCRLRSRRLPAIKPCRDRILVMLGAFFCTTLVAMVTCAICACRSQTSPITPFKNYSIQELFHPRIRRFKPG